MSKFPLYDTTKSREMFTRATKVIPSGIYGEVEYECGGEVNKATIDVSYVDVDEEYDFMKELDNIIDIYGGE